MTLLDRSAGRGPLLDDPGPDRLIISWVAPPFSGSFATAEVEALEEALLEGFAAAVPAIAAGPSRVVNLVTTVDEGPLAAAFADTIAGWGRGLARELARSDATVNTVLGSGSEADGALAGWLASPEASFVTGQTLGTLPRSSASPTRAAVDPGPVLVSGGSGDLGAAICQRLITDGWMVVVGHRPTTDPGAAAAVPLDLLDDRSILDAAARLRDDVGTLSGVVLNAGWTDTGPFVGSSEESRRAIVRTNLTGGAHLLAALSPLLAERAVVVGTGSEAGRIGEAGRAVYSGAKSGMGALMAALDGPRLRAVATAPGPYDTALLRGTWADPEKAERGIDRLRSLVPLRRLGQPDELAAAVAFAMSPAGAALGGQTISVGGGITMV